MIGERFLYDSALEKVYDRTTDNGETMESYGVFECSEIMNEQYETIQYHIKFIRECAEKQGFDSVDDFLNVIHNGRITGWEC